MNLDFTKHRLSNEADLMPYTKQTFRIRGGVVSYWRYAEHLYNKIIHMAPNEVLVVDEITEAENRDVFIKTLCAFMINGVACDFKFNNTYTEFRRCSAPITQSKENILKQTQI